MIPNTDHSYRHTIYINIGPYSLKKNQIKFIFTYMLWYGNHSEHIATVKTQTSNGCL